MKKKNNKINHFNIDRLGLDRSIWTAYYPSTVKKSKENFFDIARLERLNLENNLSNSFFNNRKESVLRFEDGEALTYELRLKATRSMTFRFNFNRRFLEIFGLKHDLKCPVIHDNNFLPLDTKISINDFCKMYQEIQYFFIELYKTLYCQVFIEDFKTYKNEEPILKCTTLEIYRELAPVNLIDIREQLLTDRKTFKSYNSQSKTMYFGEKPKIDGFENINDGKIDLITDVQSWNNHKDNRIFHAKLYQKSTTLARFERTIYNDDIPQEKIEPDQIKFMIQEAMEITGLYITPSKELTENEVTKLFADIMKLDETLIKALFNEGIYWEACKENRVITQKLKRRGILEKNMRGIWVKTKSFKNLIKPYLKSHEEQKLLNIPRLT